MPHKHWYSRGYLPHFDQPGRLQFVTFRLADSLPASKLQQWQEELQHRPKESNDTELREKIEAWLDLGSGRCHLRIGDCAVAVEQALLRFDGQRYRLLAWIIMPNHVHVLLETLPDYPLDAIVKSWKTFTARACNSLLNRSGSFWCRDYFDRFMRDGEHTSETMRYIHANPVQAGLVKNAADWRYSSAWHGRSTASP